MTRVNDNREAQRLQQEKMSQERKASDKQDGKKFEQAMAKTGQMKGKQVQQKQGAKQQAAHQPMVRQGFAQHMQAKFQQAAKQLDQKATQSKDGDRKADMDDHSETTTETDDKKTQARLGTQDKLGAIQRDEREGGSGTGTGAGSGGEAGSQLKDDVQDAQGAMTAGGPEGAQGAEAAVVAHQAGLPPEVIEKMVDQVRVGFNPEGLAEFQFELKDSVLKGSTFSVTCKDGKVSLTVNTSDTNVRRLLQASEGQLARSMDRKGMQLERLVINQR